MELVLSFVENNFSLIIRTKEKIEENGGCCQRSLHECCKEDKKNKCLMCKFSKNLQSIFERETSKQKIHQNIINLFISYQREFTFVHFFYRGDILGYNL